MQVFPCEFCELFKNIVFYRTPTVATSPYPNFQIWRLQPLLKRSFKNVTWSYNHDVMNMLQTSLNYPSFKTTGFVESRRGDLENLTTFSGKYCSDLSHPTNQIHNSHKKNVFNPNKKFLILSPQKTNFLNNKLFWPYMEE